MEYYLYIWQGNDGTKFNIYVIRPLNVFTIMSVKDTSDVVHRLHWPFAMSNHFVNQDEWNIRCIFNELVEDQCTMMV